MHTQIINGTKYRVSYNTHMTATQRKYLKMAWEHIINQDDTVMKEWKEGKQKVIINRMTLTSSRIEWSRTLDNGKKEKTGINYKLEEA